MRRLQSEGNAGVAGAVVVNESLSACIPSVEDIQSALADGDVESDDSEGSYANGNGSNAMVEEAVFEQSQYGYQVTGKYDASSGTFVSAPAVETFREPAPFCVIGSLFECHLTVRFIFMGCAQSNTTFVNIPLNSRYCAYHQLMSYPLYPIPTGFLHLVV